MLGMKLIVHIKNSIFYTIMFTGVTGLAPRYKNNIPKIFMKYFGVKNNISESFQ